MYTKLSSEPRLCDSDICNYHCCVQGSKQLKHTRSLHVKTNVKLTYHKVTHLKVYSSIEFSTNNRLYLVSKHFYHPGKKHHT